MIGTRREGIALVGYRGTGKTTVGRLLAARLGWDFLDADEVLEAEAGVSIPTIFATEGEPAFRNREADVIRRLTKRERLVLATGGGAVLRDENREALQQFGLVVWLTGDPDTIRRRLGSAGGVAGRPSLTPAGTLAEVETVLLARTPLYREVANVILDTAGRRPGSLAAAIEAAIRDLNPPTVPSGKDTTTP